MNTRTKAGGEIEREVVGVIQVPYKALAAGIEMPVNPDGFTDEELRTILAQMDQASTLLAKRCSLIRV